VKITKIKTQNRNKRRCSIYIDGEFKFGLTQDIVIKYGLHEGDDITENMIELILHHEECNKIRQRAFKILHFRERSTEELKQRLLKVGYESELVDKVIQELVEDKTLDDQRFAQAFLSDYTKLKPRGNRFIARELNKKGIPTATINEILELRDEKPMIRNLLERKLAGLNPHNPKDRAKIIRRLMNRGFSLETIYDVINHDS
jgi:regulatory protein